MPTFNPRKFRHDLFRLEVFEAYMQVLNGRELLIRATTEVNPLLSHSLFAWNLEKIEVRPFLELFLHTEMARNFTFHSICFQNKHVFPSASTWRL